MTHPAALNHWQAPGAMNTAALAAGTTFGNVVGTYDAAKRGNRQGSPSQIRGEDDHLNKRDRAAVTGSAMDLRRNSSLVKWAIKKHLDYVSHFRFQAKTGDADLNTQIENLWRWWSNAENCDQTKRFNFRKMIRLAESTRTVGGDVALVKNQYGRLQMVEPDRICQPTDKELTAGEKQKWVQGVLVGATGEALAYAVCERGAGNERKWQTTVPAADVIFIAYRERFDQYRGVSLIADAINDFRDLYEAKDYALAKIKLAQLFGVKIKRQNAGDPETGLMPPGDTTERTSYDINFKDGPMMVDLEPGDDAEIMESHNPSSETQAYMVHVIMMALKCLDLDYSFFDSSHTNFYGSRAALNSYLKACEPKQEDLIEAQDKIAYWIIGFWIDAGLLVLPAGMTISDVRWEFIPDGVPFWDTQKDALGTASLIAMGLETFEGVARKTNSEWQDNIIRNAASAKFARDNGVPIMLPGVQGLMYTKPSSGPVGSGIESIADHGDDAEVISGIAKEADLALNGAQVSSLIEITSQVRSGALPVESAKAIAKSAFPNFEDSAIDEIFDPIKVDPLGSTSA